MIALGLRLALNVVDCFSTE